MDDFANNSERIVIRINGTYIFNVILIVTTVVCMVLIVIIAKKNHY